MIEKLKNLFYAKEGVLTKKRELKDSPIGRLPANILPDTIAGTICGYCSLGCSLNVHIKDGKAVNLTPTVDYSVNSGRACPKGWEALAPLNAKSRAVTPLLRDRNSKRLMPMTWDKALKIFVDKFKTIQEKYGKGSVAFLSTGQIPVEEMALLGALSKFGMGILEGDGNTRQCMATAVVAYKQSFGFDAPPYTFGDIDESDVLVFIGANPCIAHPILWGRVERSEKKPKVIVIDPRETETAVEATKHYAPYPKTDLALFYCIANILVEKGWIDLRFINDHTNGFDEFKNHVKSFTLEKVSQMTGLNEKNILELTKIIHEGKNVSFWWTMGVNQSYEGVRTAQAIINISLMTGNIGRPGTGANSITGQCNAMGSRLFSNTTGLFAGYDFAKEDDREKVASILNIDKNLIPQRASISYDKILDDISRNKIKGLWVIATNPAHSWINQNDFLDLMGNLDFLVVQDMYSDTETAKLADLILPSAGWGEKEGTFINTERRFGLVQKVANAPGEAISDFYIFKLIAEYWGCGDMFKDWESPEAVFQILKKLSKDTPCDITGIENYNMIYRYGGIQWPFSSHSRESGNLKDLSVDDVRERRLFEDGRFYHADGKAKFIFSDLSENPEPVSAKFPLLLLTGRGTSSQWHTQTRTRNSAVLRKLYPENNFVVINPTDAKKLGIADNALVNVSTRRGSIKARAFINTSVKPGQIFVPMHYEDTNKLTFPAFDPYSRQPSYKMCAANVMPILHYES